MKKTNLFKTLLIATCFSTFVTSCVKDEEETIKKVVPTTEKTKYVVAFQENKIGAAEEVDYILKFPSLESLTKGTFDLKGKGILQTGWRFFHQAKNTLFTAGYSDDVTCQSYFINSENKFLEKASFTFDKTLNIFGDTEDGKVIAVELHFAGFEKLRFHIIDPSTGKIENIIEREFDFDRGAGTAENPGSIPWITGMIQQSGKLYVSYYKTSADGKTKTPNNDKAKMAIFSYPAITLDKIITDARTTQIGINGGDTGIVKDENGNMYTYSSSCLTSGYTTATKPSGILKLKQGTTEFDSDYFFDVENAVNGGKLHWMQYVGNGKALARIILDHVTGAPSWSGFLERNTLRMVILDLNAKTVTDVTGVPNPQGQRYISRTGLLIEDGKIYTGITNSTETAVYIIDPETATATKGAVATNARSLKGIFKL